MIPKIIHYCWLSGDPIPKKLEKCMKSWKKKLPDYEIMLWDFNRFDINSSLWVKQAFENKKYAFAADYIRLYAVYHYGGIYMDMDVEVVKSFNDLLDKNVILGKETEIGIEAGVFGAEKGGEWLKECLDYYRDRKFVQSDGSFDMKVLPSIMYNVLNDKYILTNRLKVFPAEYFTAKSYVTGEIQRTRNTYSIHHFAGSWLPPVKLPLKDLIKKKSVSLIGYRNTIRVSKLLKKLKII